MKPGFAGVAVTALMMMTLLAGAAPAQAAMKPHVLRKGESSVEWANGLRFRVRFDSYECKRRFPGMGLDPATYESADAVARPGKKLCLVTLSVRNINRRPGFWYISFSSDAFLRTSRNLAYSPWQEPYSQGTIANLKGVRFAGDSDYIQPREREYDFIFYEVPGRLQPRAVEIPQ